MGTDYYLYDGEIKREGLGKLTKCLQSRISASNRQEKAVLFLLTPGGDPDTAYKIAKLFQSVYQRFDVAVPFSCKSAGTLIACGAHTIHYGIFGELGPLDMQLSRDDEIYGQLSSLVATKGLDDILGRSFLTFESNLLEILNKSRGRLATKTAADIAVKLTDALYRPIMEQFDPMRVGEHARSTEVANAYGERLNQKYKNLTPNSLGRLIYSYPSHSFVIDIEEARELFHQVEQFSDELNSFLQLGIQMGEQHGSIFFIGEQHDQRQTNQNHSDGPNELPEQASEQLDGKVDERRPQESEGLREFPTQKRKPSRTNGTVKIPSSKTANAN